MLKAKWKRSKSSRRERKSKKKRRLCAKSRKFWHRSWE